MIKNIVFDLGGVIIDLDRKKCLDAFETILGFPDFETFLSAYLQKGFFADFEEGVIDAAEFRKQVRKHATRKEVTDNDIDFALCEFLAGIKAEKGTLLLELKKRGYKLYLLSNNNPIAWKYSRELFREGVGMEIGEVFDALFCSFEMKKLKPGKAIFEQMLSRADIQAGETLFVDDAAANIETAGGMGFHTLLYDVEDALGEKVMEALERHG